MAARDLIATAEKSLEEFPRDIDLQPLAKGELLSLDQIEDLYKFFCKNEGSYQPEVKEDDGGLTAGTVVWLLKGGHPAQRWARRILRQHDRLQKQRGSGSVSLPTIIDAQLGTQFIGVGVVDADEAADWAMDVEVPCSIIKSRDGSGWMFLNYDELGSDVRGDILPQFSVSGDLDIVEATKSRACGLLKGIDQEETSQYDAYELDASSVELLEDLTGYEIPFDLCDEPVLFKLADTEATAQVLKIDEELGLVFGWAIICKLQGEEFFDSQDDHVPEDAMLEAATDFMLKSRMGGDMHERVDGEPVPRGTIVFAFPLTEDIAKSFGIDCDRTGLMVAMKPDSDEMLQKFRDGTYTGFSIGGRYIESDFEEVNDE